MPGSALVFAALVAQPAGLPAAPIPAIIANPPEIAAPIATEALGIGGSTVQGRADRDDRMTVDVRIGGAGPYRFVVDTGSQNTVLSTALAGTLGLAPGPQVRVMGMAGVQSVSTSQLASMEVGRHEFHDLTVPLLEAVHLGADGLIGTDSLRDRRVVLDFARNRIDIDEGAAKRQSRSERAADRAGFDIIVRARPRSGRLIITNAMIDGVRTDVVVDTGASSSIGNAPLRKALGRKTTAQIMLATVTGQDIAANLGLARVLRIEKLAVENVAIAYADAPVFAELDLDKRPAIFLGMRELREFKRIAIDFSRHKVLFDLPD